MIHTEPVAPEDRGASRFRWAWGALASIAFALSWLLWNASSFRSEAFHVQGLWNDEAGYLTTARILADTGEWESGLIYPAYVENPRFRPYMPGHYAALAASFALFGFSPISSILPSAAGYLVAAVATFLLAHRLYGLRAGLFASALVALYPGFVAFSFTAMGEMTFVGASVLALAAFVHLPVRRRVLAGPFLLLVPFLFRETGAVLVVPMAWLLWGAMGDRTRAERLRAVAGLALGSVLVLYAAQSWQIATGKEALPLTWVTQASFNYADATAVAPSLSPGEWVAALADNARRNSATLITWIREHPRRFETLSFVTLFVVAAGALAAGALFARRRPFLLAAGLLAALAFTLNLFLYDTPGFKVLRASLFTFPFCAVGLAGFLEPARRTSLAVAVVLVLAFLPASANVAHRAGTQRRISDSRTALSTEILERLDHDPAELLISPFQFSLDYAVRHYPVRWSFVPANDATLAKLAERYTIGTLILELDDLGPVLSPGAIRAVGLAPGQVITYGRRKYRVFTRR